MTREELVKKKAQEFASSGEFSPTLTECFIAGAEWEHKMLVEKACEWIDAVDISKYLSCIFSGAANISFISDDFIRDFKKAMGEK